VPENVGKKLYVIGEYIGPEGDGVENHIAVSEGMWLLRG